MFIKRRKNTLFIMLILITIVFSVLLFRNEVSSQERQVNPATKAVVAAPSGIYLSYQGQVLDDNGQPVNATLPMTFELFQTLTGGTACASWSESPSVVFTDGVFSVTLGQTTAIPDECLIDDIYLQLTIDGETLAPREQLTPFANTLPDDATVRGDLTVQGETLHIGSTLAGLEAHIKLENDDSITFNDTNSLYGSGAFFFNADTGTGNARLFASRLSGPDGGYLQLHSTEESLAPSEAWVRGAWMWMSAIDNAISPTHGGSARIHIAKDTQLGNSPMFDIIRVQEDGESQRVFSVNESGHITIGGCSIESNDASSAEVASSCTSGSITTGAVIEANLQTQEEMRSEKNERFEQGDLLCWSTTTEQLELCETADDRLVMAVADVNGKPIVMGAEPLKVIGTVQAGDILVTSDVPGYAKVNNDPAPGTVIGQALENFDGTSGTIKAMIRKW